MYVINLRLIFQVTTESCKENGEPYEFFDSPKNKAKRLVWSLYVPRNNSFDAFSDKIKTQSKVCERHFVDGRPTREYPFPAKNLFFGAGTNNACNKEIYIEYEGPKQPENEKTGKNNMEKNTLEHIKSQNDETKPGILRSN